MEQSSGQMMDLERALMDALLIGDDPMLASLREQYATAVVSKRHMTGVGFFTYFAIALSAPRISPPNFMIGDLTMDIVGVDSGAMAMVFIEGGVISNLEVITIAGDWPDNPSLRSITYASHEPGSPDKFMPSSKRNIDVVRKSWERG